MAQWDISIIEARLGDEMRGALSLCMAMIWVQTGTRRLSLLWPRPYTQTEWPLLSCGVSLGTMDVTPLYTDPSFLTQRHTSPNSLTDTQSGH